MHMVILWDSVWLRFLPLVLFLMAPHRGLVPRAREFLVGENWVL